MKRCQCPVGFLPLVRRQTFGYDSPAMEPADPGPRDPYPLERRTFMEMIVGGLFAAPLVAEAQTAGRIWRIGILSPSTTPSETARRQSPLMQKLAELDTWRTRTLWWSTAPRKGRSIGFPGSRSNWF